MQKTLTIPASLRAVSEMIAGLETTLAELSLEERVEVTLALQELCVNIVNHAYEGTPGQIRLHLEVDSQTLRVIIGDDAPGTFTPPDEIHAPDPTELPESGMGLYIITQCFDQVTYERLASGNRWQLSKKLGG